MSPVRRAPRFEHHYTDVGEVRLHHVSLAANDPAGRERAPAVLLHGWPETWFEWRHVMPTLARERWAIAPDLRGLGDSSRPLHGYDKRTVAADIARQRLQVGIRPLWIESPYHRNRTGTIDMTW